MAATDTVRARIDAQLKNEATAVLDELGLTISDVVRITLTRIAKEGGMPFDLRLPNAETRKAMQEASAIMKEQQAGFIDPQEMFDDLEEKSTRK